MQNRYAYFEDFSRAKVTFQISENDRFAFSAPSSIHSEITDWAYGKVLSRRCFDLAKIRFCRGDAEVEKFHGRRFWLKLTACLSDWEKYENDLAVTVNGATVAEGPVFFENVNLGWPTVFFEIPEGLVKEKNEITLATKNTTGGGLYISEASLLSLPDAEDGAQISVARYAKAGGRFAVAVRQREEAEISVTKAENCIFLGYYHRRGYGILCFTAGSAGAMKACAVCAGKPIALTLPCAVAEEDRFLVGIDSDDHRHDDSEETDRIPETFLFSGMGDMFQWRPQEGRNFARMGKPEEFRMRLSMLRDFGVCYSLCDRENKMTFLNGACPDSFFGASVHEPYLFFNPVLEGNDFFACALHYDFGRLRASQSFGESKAVYIETLKKIRADVPGDGKVAVGSPSLLCVYEGNAGFERVSIEPVSNLNLLVGAVRPTAAEEWGAHIPIDWYFGIPVDDSKSRKFRLAMQYLYLNGASYLYAENAVFKTNAFERLDFDDRHIAKNRGYLRDFYDYKMTHPRRGKILTDKAILYGRNEFFLWQEDDRMAELNPEGDWDNRLFGKWEPKHHRCWLAAYAWLPKAEKQNAVESPVNKNLFAGTPYGNVDIVDAERDFSGYKTVALLGWNTMDEDLIRRLTLHAENGGAVILSRCHFNMTDNNVDPMTFPDDALTEKLLGLGHIGSRKIAGNVTLGGQVLPIGGEAVVSVCETRGAKILASSDDGLPVAYENTVGRGKVYYIAAEDYLSLAALLPLEKAILQKAGDEGELRLDNPNISFTLREEENGTRHLHLLNMNCAEEGTERFTLTICGEEIRGKVSVGEIVSYTKEPGMPWKNVSD